MIEMMSTDQNPTIKKTTSSKKDGRMWGLDLDSWNSVMLASLGAAAIAAFAIVVSTRAVIVLQKAEEQATKLDFDKFKLEAGQKIAEANKIAEGEKLARLKLEAKLAPRSLSPQERQELGDKIRPFAGISVDMFIVPTGTPDTAPFSGMLGQALSIGQWTIRDAKRAAGGQTFIGISVGRSNDAPQAIKDAAQALVDGLRAANIDAELESLFGGDGTWTSSGPGLRQRTLMATPPAPISIVIGSKP